MFLVFLSLFLLSTCLDKDFDEENFDYCKINENHILCGKDKPIKTGKFNLVHYSPNETDQKERNLFVERINVIRSTVAAGNFTIGNSHLPPAANMLELVWDKICEKAAFNLLRDCHSHKLANCCNCVNTGKTDLFVTEHDINYSEPRIYQYTLRKAFYNFYEINKYNMTDFEFECVNNVTKECLTEAYGFLFGLLFARQVRIGCAYGECLLKGDLNFTRGHLICVTNLDRHLDMIGKRPYDQGDAATKCPKPDTLKEGLLCKCNDTEKCLIKPAELSPKCTTRSGTLTTPPPTKHVPKMTPAKVEQHTMEKVPPQGLQDNDNNLVPPNGDKHNKKHSGSATKKISGLGGGGDTSGVKNLEDGDNVAFMFVMIWFLFMY